MINCCSFATRLCAFSSAGFPMRISPNSANILIICALSACCCSAVLFFDFSSNSWYSGVSPHDALARAAYSSIFFVSNTEKSNVLTPIVLIPRARSIRFSRCSFLRVSNVICCSSALSLSKDGLSKISRISFKGNSSARNSKICCNLSSAVSSYSL